LTGSTIAQRVLDSWASMVQRIVAVVPRDYKRIRGLAQNAGGTRQPVLTNLVA
jgi:glutamate synthase domain-containing protein 3